MGEGKAVMDGVIGHMRQLAKDMERGEGWKGPGMGVPVALSMAQYGIWVRYWAGRTPPSGITTNITIHDGTDTQGTDAHR